MRFLLLIWVQLRNIYMYVFRNAIIINGYVEDLKWRGIVHRNWGDDINYYFIQLMTNRPVVFYHHFKFAQWLHLTNYMCIGTVLDSYYYCNRKTIVWGSGSVGVKWEFEYPEKVCSVRGKLTRNFLIDNDISCPEIYGDPASILPLYYQPQNKGKKYRMGIIPHVVDLKHSLIQEIGKKHKDILIIDLANYQCWTDIIDQICSCECIVSSSLHGLIVSDAYGIPNSWIKLSSNIVGGYFKFYDYASSVQRELDQPYFMESINCIPKLISLCSQWQQPVIDTQGILSACPFNIKSPLN